MTVRPAGCRAEVVPSLSHLAWWPAPGTAEDAHWSRETIAVVRKVAATQRAVLYGRRGYEALADDLESYLTDRAEKFRHEWVSPTQGSGESADADESADASQSGHRHGSGTELADWLAVLHTVLTQAARWHFNRFYARMGVPPGEARWQALAGDSTDRRVPGAGGYEGTAIGELGTAVWPRPETLDPLDQLLQVERLAQAAAEAWGVVIHRPTLDVVLYVLDLFAPSPGAGLCRVWGCGRPAKKRRLSRGGLCAVHTAQERAERMPPCREDDCQRPQLARGLCSRHYQRVRAAEKAAEAAQK